MTPRTFTARWVFPVSGPPLAGGTVTVAGDRIASVDAAGVRTPDEDFGTAALIPGLVNAHTHLDLTGARGLIPPTDPDHFTDWLRGVIGYRRGRTPEQVQADIRAGLAECLRAGTTLIGDIAAEGASWDAMASAKMWAVVFRELIGLGDRASVAAEAFDVWYDSLPDDLSTCVPGYSPHAPYSVSRAFLHLAGMGGVPAAIHLAESPAECELIESRAGEFVQFLRDVGAWEEGYEFPPHQFTIRTTASDLSYFGDTRRVQDSPHDGPVLFVHCNYLPPNTLFGSNQSVVYCPRTHAAFGHPPHPFPEFLKRGVRVALGTDSLASNPDLDLLAEARFIRERYPDVPGDAVLRMATLAGAEALGWADECGSLDAGKSADFVVVPLPDRDGDPHDLLLGPDVGERRTMFRGEWRPPLHPEGVGVLSPGQRPG